MASGGRPNSASSWRLHSALPLEVAGGVVGGEVAVGGGVPFGVIHTVKDAGEHIGAVTQAAIQAEAELRGLDLAGVGGADGVQGVGELYARLDVADAAEEFHTVGTVEGGVEADVGEGGAGEESLVARDCGW